MDLQVGERFSMCEQIGSGTFGDIYLGKDTTTGQEVAVKLETAGYSRPQLLHEADVYKRALKDGVGIPRTLWSGVEGDYDVLVMELLGPSLENLFDSCGRRFSLKTVLMIADQLLTRIEYVHGKGYLHMDIKPNNFLIGLGRKQHIIYVVDFGLAKRYVDEKTQEHIAFRSNQQLTGTARYASINTHKGVEQSRRDDLEALGNVLLYFLRGSLPWQGLKASTAQKKCRMIEVLKTTTTVEELCGEYPDEFRKFLEYARNLGFAETPDYAALKRSFKELFERMGFKYDYVYDWLEPHGTAKKSRSDKPTAAPAAAAASSSPAAGTGDVVTKSPSLSRARTPTLHPSSHTGEVPAAAATPPPAPPSSRIVEPHAQRLANPAAGNGDDDNSFERQTQGSDVIGQPAAKRARLMGPTNQRIRLSNALPEAGGGLSGSAKLSAGWELPRLRGRRRSGSDGSGSSGGRAGNVVANGSGRRSAIERRAGTLAWSSEGGAALPRTISAERPGRGDHGEAEERWTSGRQLVSDEEAIKAAIKAFQPPPGQRRVPVPPPRSSRSLLYLYGVVAEDDVENPDSRTMYYYCMANEQCRQATAFGAGGSINVRKNATGNGTRHLKKVHGVESEKTRKERDWRKAKSGLMTRSEEVCKLRLDTLERRAAEAMKQIEQHYHQQPLLRRSSSAGLDAAGQSPSPPPPLPPPPAVPQSWSRPQPPAAASTTWTGLAGWVDIASRGSRANAGGAASPPSAACLSRTTFLDSGLPPPRSVDSVHQLMDHPKNEGNGLNCVDGGIVHRGESMQEGTGRGDNVGSRNEQRRDNGSVERESKDRDILRRALSQEQQQQQQHGEGQQEGQLERTSSQRSMALMFVKLFVVSMLSGFDVAVGDEMQGFLRWCTVPTFPRSGLSPDRIRLYITELYVATKEALAPGLLQRRR